MAADGDEVAGALKAAMRTLARSVSVVTVAQDDKPYAIAATAISEVSLAPPSMLVCVNRERSLCDLLAIGARFALNILSAAHEDVSRACGGGATQGEGRFAIGRWRHGLPGQPPILEDACAAITMIVAAHLDHGSHRIVVGNVESVAFDGTLPPLLYHDQRYARVAS